MLEILGKMSEVERGPKTKNLWPANWTPDFTDSLYPIDKQQNSKKAGLFSGIASKYNPPRVFSKVPLLDYSNSKDIHS